MLGEVSVAQTVRVSAAQEMAGFVSCTQNIHYVLLKNMGCRVTLGDDAVNESRGKLLWICEEAHDASEFITGEKDEKNTSLHLTSVGSSSLGSFLSRTCR